MRLSTGQFGLSVGRDGREVQDRLQRRIESKLSDREIEPVVNSNGCGVFDMQHSARRVRA